MSTPILPHRQHAEPAAAHAAPHAPPQASSHSIPCSPPPPPVPPLVPNHNRRSSKKRRAVSRLLRQEATGDSCKTVSAKHRMRALERVVEVDYDAAAFPVNSSGFGGLRRYPTFTNYDAETLQREHGFRYLPHDGKAATPIVDRHRRMIALVGTTPANADEWEREVVAPIVRSIEEGAPKVRFSKKEKKHKRGPFRALAIGVSYGGGEKVSLPYPAWQALSEFTLCLETG